MSADAPGVLPPPRAAPSKGAAAAPRALAYAFVFAFGLALAPPLGLAAQSPVGGGRRPAKPDTGFAAAVARLSEPGGYFDTDNLISNEASYQHVLGKLDALGIHGGAYLGVGPDQNFTYIAAIRPELAIIVDIRRDNLLQQLLFRALFQLSRDRLEYLALLLGRPLPASRAATGDVDGIVAYLDATPMRPATLDSALAAVRRTVLTYGVPLSDADLATIRRFHTTFARAGLGLRFESFGRGSQGYDPTLRQLVLERDLDGRRRSYLAEDQAFQFVRALELRGRVIPVVGDLAGSGALPAIAEFLRERRLPLTAYYTSNVEFYLAREDKLAAFIADLRQLPRDPHGVVIRSVFRFTLPQSAPGYASTQLLQRMDDLLAAWDGGKIHGYYDLVTVAALPAR